MKEKRIIKTFSCKIKNNEKAKFSIVENLKNNQFVYSAKVVGEEIPFYEDLGEVEKMLFPGTNVMDENNRILLYLDPERLERDLKEFYGEKRLKSEI